MLCAIFESIFKPVDEQYKEKTNKIKTGRKRETPYAEKMNIHVPPGGCVHSLFAHEDIPEPS